METLRLDTVLWTPQELAAYLGRTRAAVYMMVARGQLPYIKIGGGKNGAIRFDKAEILALMEQRKTDALKPVV